MNRKTNPTFVFPKPPLAGKPDHSPATAAMQGLFARPPTSLSEMGAISSTLAGYAFLWATFSRFLTLLPFLALFRRLRSKLFPEVCITVPHHPGYGHSANELYFAVESYLRGAATETADNLKAAVGRDGAVALSLDKGEQVADAFQGVPLLWTHCYKHPDDHKHGDKRGGGGGGGGRGSSSSGGGEKRWYSLRFLRRYRSLVLENYLDQILAHAREMEGKTRKRRLYSNCSSSSSGWNDMPFEHPASFETLAMEVSKKKRIMDDLSTFRQSKEYYAKIGKAWKRGYLLYGPPGTGKSTLVAAMANYLCYDVYDLDLSAVRSNGQLRKLLASTGSKSVLVVEDIDCSLQLAGARKPAKKKKKTKHDKIFTSSSDDEDYELESALGKSEVTLSGLLNLIDGLWSVSQGERIIVFTTNHVGKLDPALIRRGRMDVHVEMSYCRIEGLKILAKNYLEVEDHPMLDEVVKMVEEVSITPADVAEQLMPKTLEASAPETVEACLKDLAETMKKMKEVDL